MYRVARLSSDATHCRQKYEARPDPPATAIFPGAARSPVRKAIPIAAGIAVAAAVAAYALSPFFMETYEENTGAIVINAMGSSVPGCEETDECFIPSVVTVDVGGEVAWINEDAAAHTITSGILADGGPDGVFDSGLFVSETTFAHTFDSAGVYPYFCMVHPWMSGLVIVQDT